MPINTMLKSGEYRYFLEDSRAKVLIVDALKAHVKGKIAGFKIPQWIEFADDLPKTATGKIRRFTLRN